MTGPLAGPDSPYWRGSVGAAHSLPTGTTDPTDELVARIRVVIQEELARTRRSGWHCRSCDGHACDDD